MIARKTTVLVVDDEDYVRELLRRILEEAGYAVVTAANGGEALESLPGTKVDLILLDIKMPGLNGFEVLKMIREQYDIPVIMLTAIREGTSVGDALNIGADDYVRKPFKRGELLARIKAKLRRYR